MGMDLVNERGESLGFSPGGWALVLNLAEVYGWVPEGTTLHLDDDRVWPGNYDTNDDQRVSASDAAAMATAWERALAADDFTARVLQLDRELFGEEVEPSPAAADGKPPFPSRSALDVDELRDALTDLIQFCREGSFQIG